jgi:hypothetical protein
VAFIRSQVTGVNDLYLKSQNDGEIVADFLANALKFFVVARPDELSDGNQAISPKA